MEGDQDVAAQAVGRLGPPSARYLQQQAGLRLTKRKPTRVNSARISSPAILPCGSLGLNKVSQPLHELLLRLIDA